MSTSVTTSFITAYNARLKLVFQREGTMLLPAVRWSKDVVGSTEVFQVLGTGAATTKARHGNVTPMNQSHTTATATLADFYAGDYVDALDEAKLNIGEQDAIVRTGAQALGRKIDDQIFVALDATTQSAITWTTTSEYNIRKALLDMAEALYQNNIPNDGRCYGALSTKGWAMAMTVREFSSSDWVTAEGRPFDKGAPMFGRWKEWMGIKWSMHTGVPGHNTSSAKPFVWHKDAIGYASGKHPKNFANRGSVVADITWVGEKAAHFVNHMMSGGAVLIDDLGVIEGALDDTAGIPVVASTAS